MVHTLSANATLPCTPHPSPPWPKEEICAPPTSYNSLRPLRQTYYLRINLLITHLYFCSRSETLTSLMNSSMALWSVRSATVGALTRPGSGMFSFIHCSTNVSHLSDTTTCGNADRFLLWQSETTIWKHKYIYHKSSSITKFSATTMHETTC